MQLAYATPLDAAMSSVHVPPDAEILATVESDRHAGFVVHSSAWEHPEVLHCYYDEDGWQDGTITSGMQLWSLTDEDLDTGVYVVWGVAEPGTIAYDITFLSSRFRVPVTHGFFVWMVE